MYWQDYVLAAGSLIFTLALVPSIKSDHKPALATSLLTSAVLFTVVFTYATLSLWFSVVSASFNCFAWLVLAFQKYFQSQD
ncbi:MAG: hypothetical protein AAB462_00660 [Patescibacteria group bacterium]